MSNDSLVNTPRGAPPPPSEPEPEIPAKFRGKSPAEIASAYTALEQTLGRQASELGQLRAAVAQSQQAARKPVDILDDPEAAVSEIVERRVAPIVEHQFTSALDKAHPEWREVVKTSEFEDWVLRSKVRRSALAQAQRYDLESAVDLLEQWSERQRARDGAEEAAEDAVKRDRKLRSSVTESGTAKRTSGKTYSRRWIQQLRMTDPAGYRAQLPEIKRAYEEGRTTE
jgi:hypothetical protein